MKNQHLRLSLLLFLVLGTATFLLFTRNALGRPHAPLLLPTAPFYGEKASESRTPQLCVVARTYSKQFDYLPVFLLALGLGNPVARPRVFLAITDEFSSFSRAEAVAENVNRMLAWPMASVLPPLSHLQPEALLKESNNKEEKAAPPPKDFGYSYTDSAIELLLKQDVCDYFLFTNGDNLYVNGFIDNYIANDMRRNIDVMGFGFTSAHARFDLGKVDGYIQDDFTKHYVDPDFVRAELDLGAFVVKAKLLKDDPDLRFVTISQRTVNDFWWADAYFIEEAASKARSKIIHRQTLLIHQ